MVVRRKLSSGQWIGCCIVVASPTVGGNLASQLSDRSNAEIALGAGMILFGSVSHAYTWVLVELLLGESDPVPPEAVSTVMGVAGVGTFCAWQLIWTLPRADQLVFDVIRAHGGHNDVIALSYLLLTLASLVHAVTFYHLVGRMGAVTAGVLKGCQAVAVFIGSHFFFCEAQVSQCFSVFKAWSLVLVLLGTAIYALSRGSRDNVGRHAASGDGERDSGGDVEHHGKCCFCCCCCCCGNGGSGGDSKAECAGCLCCFCCCPPQRTIPTATTTLSKVWATPSGRLPAVLPPVLGLPVLGSISQAPCPVGAPPQVALSWAGDLGADGRTRGSHGTSRGGISLRYGGGGDAGECAPRTGATCKLQRAAERRKLERATGASLALTPAPLPLARGERGAYAR